MIRCPSCQKEYRWKPELAGKRVKCVCGELIDVPASDPDADENDLYDLAEEPTAKAHPGMGDLQSAASSSSVALADSGQFACPYCGQMIDAGTEMCVFCGSSLEGAVIPKSARRSVPTAMQAAPPVAARPVAMRAPTEDETANKIKLILIAVMALAILIGAIFAVRHFMPKPAAKDPNLKPSDAAMLDQIQAQNGTEAKEWINANDRHMLGGWNKKQALSKLDDLYQLGATKVLAFGAGYCLSIAIELPDDAAKRKALFEWQRKWQLEHNERPAKDEGQRWVEVVTPR